MFAPKRKRSSRRRRKNPGGASVGPALLGAGVGTVAGVGTAFALDKVGISTPTVRAWAMVGLGALGAIVAGLMGSSIGAGVGAGVAAVGGTRALLPAQGVVSPPSSLKLLGKTKSIKGLGSGTGEGDGLIDADDIELVELVDGADDVDGAYDEVHGAYDDVGAVSEEIELVEGSEDIELVEGAYDDA